MGLRFRRSVKICKGVRVNFNKKSWGLSVGGRGYGYSFNSKGRQTKHIGIPGTGLSYVSSTSTRKGYSKTRKKHSTIVKTTIRLHMDDDGKMTYFYSNGTEITDQRLINKIKRTPEYKLEKDRMQREHDKEMLDKIIKYNKLNNELININKLCPDKIYTEQDYVFELKNLKVKKYKKRSFDQPMPNEESVKLDLFNVATRKIKSIAFWSLKKKRDEYVKNNYEELYKIRYDYWLQQKKAFEIEEQNLEIENNEKYRKEFENKKVYFRNIIEGDEECICNSIDLWIGKLEMPFECNINYDYIKSKNKVLIDLDLPEIEAFPNQKAIQLANGNMKLKNKTQAELYHDYKNYVFGLALFITGHIFNISPKIWYITISGYTQRRNKIGEINDDYVYSIKFEREKLSQYNLVTVDPVDICMNFENRCNINANNSLKTIEPYSGE